MLKSWKMSVSVALVLSFAGVAIAKKPESAPGVSVYVSNGGEQILVVDTGTGKVTPIYDEPGSYYRGVAFGPGGFVYACDDTRGTIIRFDPTDFEKDPLTSGNAEVIYSDYDHPFECGWFTAEGGLVLNPAFDGQVSVCPGISNVGFIQGTSDYCEGKLQPLSLDILDGQGLTQTKWGDLLAVDSGDGSDGAGSVEKLGYDLNLGGFGQASTQFLWDLDRPVGIARRSTDHVIVATNGATPAVTAYKPDGTGTSCSLEFPGETLNFVDIAADDTLYLGKSGHLVVISTAYSPDLGTLTCSVSKSIKIGKPASDEPIAVGVAVPPTSVEGVPFNIAANRVAYTFFDHAWDLYPLSDASCATVTAQEILPGDLKAMIPLAQQPFYTTPVIHVGAGGFAQLYDVSFDPDCEVGDIIHANSIISPLPSSPAIVHFLSNGTIEELTLESIFPENGLIPYDGRISGGGRGGSPFAQFNTNEYVQPEGNACLCPVEPPLREAAGPLDPNIAHFTQYTEVPVKFRILDYEGCAGFSQDELANYCRNSSAGDYIEDAIVTLSMAEIDPLDDTAFTPVTVPSASGDPLEPAIFEQPSPTSNASQYSFNLLLSYDPGLYKLVLFFNDKDLAYPVNGRFAYLYLYID